MALAACGDDDAPPGAGLDASAADAGADGALPVDAGTVDAAVDAAAPEALSGPAVAYVGEEACYATAFSADAFTFVWGDGERSEVVTPEACHTWTYPGSFLVSVVAGGRDASRTVQVVFRPAERAPEASSPLLLDPVSGRAFAANADADTLAVVDTGSLEREAELPTCAGPRTLALSGRVLAVSCQRAGALARFDADTLAPLGEVELGAGARPFGVAADPRYEGAGGRFVVALQDAGEVAVVEGDAVIGRASVGPDPRAVALNDRGLALVSRWRATAEGGHVYRVDLTTPSEPALRGEALLPRQEGLDSDTDNSGVPGFLDALAFTPDGARALLPALKANNVSGLFRTGEPFDSQTTARAVLVELFAAGAGDPSDGVEETFRVSFDDLDFGSALAITPVGDRLFVAMMGAQRVVALDAFSFDTLGSIADVGVAPRALALDEDAAGRERLWVFATLSRELRVYDVSELSREPPLLAAVPTLADEPLAPEVLRGKQLFHTSVDPRMSRTSYLSCASCHLDGESDGLVWDFTQRGEGLRNTIDLRGHGVGHGAIHWSGNFDEVQDFEGDIRNGQGGTGFLSEAHWAETAAPLGPPKAGLSEELDALAAYVASLTRVGTSPFRRDDGAFDLARARGAAVFADAGCAGCHAGEAFTDSAVGVRHDVGTLSEASGERLGEALDGLDTPTLRGLWRTAPYLHDGSAPTLEAVLTTRNPDDAHGATSDLSEAERADLLLYLRTLDDLE